MDVLQVIFAILGLVTPIITLIVVNAMKTNQSNMTNQLSALKEQGQLRGDHLESKIVDVKMYVGEAIEGIKNDFADLKKDVGQRQIIEEGLKRQILDEIHALTVKFEVIKKDVNIVQSLYDKRIEHEGEMRESIDEIKYELSSIKQKLRNSENDNKKIKRILKDNGMRENDD
jgi:hypothetical protein